MNNGNTKPIVMNIGDKYGQWTILETTQKIGTATACRCQCSCGKIRDVKNYSLRVGATTSCGCQRGVLTRQRVTRHGDASSLTEKAHYLYTLWVGIKARCFNKDSTGYHNYGGRGVTMQKNWIYNYEIFKKDILEKIGERPEGMSLDRKDNNGHYIIDNLKWSTDSEQMKNRNPWKWR